MALDDFDLPLSTLEQQLVEWAREALDLRFGEVAGRPPPQLPEVGASPNQVLERLLAVRQRLDRVEEILARTTRARGRTSRASSVAKAQADDAWDQASHRGRSSAVRRGGDFEGPRERYADNNLASLSELRSAREVARLADVAQESVEVIRLAHRGLDSLRQDLIAILRALAFESHLER